MPVANSKRGRAVRQYRYTVLFERLEERGYNVMVPAIPEICTFGRTLKEARAMARDGIHCVIESALKEGEPIPRDAEPTKERVTVSI